MLKRKIGIHIQSEVQFFSIASIIGPLVKLEYEVVLLIDGHDGDKEASAMAKRTMTFVEKQGYTMHYFKELSSQCFDLLLAPYVDGKIKANCYLKYEYGTLNIKPSLTYIPHFMDRFDGFLCQSTITANLLSVYGKTFLVDNLRFSGVCKKNKKTVGKKKVLFAPTFNDDLSEIDMANIIEKLKKNYYVIVKSHHGTEYLVHNKNQRDILRKNADEYYGPEKKLAELIVDVDVCLFGNSSAVGEALYAGTPCVVYSRDLDYFRLGQLHTTLFEFVEDGDLLVCDAPDMVVDAIERSLTTGYRGKQKNLANRVFPAESKTGIEGYLKVIDYFMNDREARDYIILHRYAIDDKYKKIAYYEAMLNDATKSCKKMVEYKEQLDDLRGRKLYKIADLFYKMEGRILNGKN